MSGARALRRLLYSEEPGGPGGRASRGGPRGHRLGGSHSALIGAGAALDEPAAVLPRSGRRAAAAGLAGCLAGCLAMKVQQRERWWLGLFFMGAMYYNAVKAHKVDNGLVGHQCGFFAAGMGVIGCCGRMIMRAGSLRANGALLGLFAYLMWYEVGRYHIWSEYASEFRRERNPDRNHDLLNEYVPQGVQTEFLPYRRLSSS